MRGVDGVGLHVEDDVDVGDAAGRGVARLHLGGGIGRHTGRGDLGRENLQHGGGRQVGGVDEVGLDEVGAGVAALAFDDHGDVAVIVVEGGDGVGALGSVPG